MNIWRKLLSRTKPCGNLWLSAGLFFCLLTVIGPALNAAEPPEPPGWPENQVFQFMQSGFCTNWPDGSTSRATAYLWIPEHCQRLRGLLILCANVPEHRLVGHPAIRAVCAAHDLGIVWCVPSFMNFRKDKVKGTDMARDYPTTITFLQELLEGLARTSGYEEVATVPWLPIGESGHLLMVDALVEHSPDRCIAGIWLKNNHLPPKNRQVPALVAFGTAQQWSQDKTDIRTNWSNVSAAYEGILKQRADNPQWPLSYIIDGSSGHFSCREKLTSYVARYIDLAASARLSRDGSPKLRPVDLANGYLADLPVPGHAGHKATAFAQTPESGRDLPWFFDRTSAMAAQSFAAINWSAETQLPAFADGQGTILPFNFNGIQSATPVMDTDGITFTLHGVMLDRMPENFVAAGTPLPHTSGRPEIEWLCGAIKPVGNDRFQIALDRSWPSAACYLSICQPGSKAIRTVVQPCGIKLQKNDGMKQTISFDPIPDVNAGTRATPLKAVSSAGLPVRFFVRTGPAIVEDNELIFTPVPPRSRLPITVTVDAWQWGRATAPAVATAPLAEQEFRILSGK